MKEPISITAALALVLTTGVAMIAIFVPDLTQAAQIAIVGFGNSVIILGTAIYARQNSTPLVAPVIPENTMVRVTTPEGQRDGVATLGVTRAGEVTVSQ
jgi:hypothetical protein